MTDKQLLTDQTRFSDEGMYFESSPPSPDLGPRPPFLETKQGKFAIIAAAILGFILIIVGLAALVSNQEQIQEKMAEFAPKETRELSETEKKVDLLKIQLKAADPTKELDPFPPVNLTFRLDEDTR